MNLMAKLLMAGAVGAFMSAGAMADNNGGGGVSSQDAAVGSLAYQHGHMMCLGAINSDGTVASQRVGKVASANRIEIGTYEVFFRPPCNDVRAVRGFSRIVQPDTLGAGSLASRTCTTANRVGANNVVWVVCYDETGALADTSFFINVIR